MLVGLFSMALRRLCVLCRLVMFSLLYLLGRIAVMFCCFVVMSGCVLVMFLWHDRFV